MKYTRIMCYFVTVIVITILLTGCGSNDGNVSVPKLNVPIHTSLLGGEVKKLTDVDVSCINEELTLGSAIELLGAPHSDEMSADYPLVYSWVIDNGKQLYIRFETDDREEFMEKYRNGEFVLPEETVQYGEGGISFATANETKVLAEWLRNYKATESYIVENKKKSFIFSTMDPKNAQAAK